MTAQSNITPESIVGDLRYLQLLSRSFPTIADASTEIINLEAILNLPKGTEHFLTDIHGEYEAFQHVLKNASGAVKRKVNEIFGNTLREAEKKELCTLIYYPEEKLQLVKAREKDLDDWYLITLNQLVKVCQNVSSKYTRSKVRKSLPAEFSYIIQELLHESSIEPNKHAYINVIISTIITTKRADDFIIAMCNLIQRLTIDSLHIVGDIYDRGPGAHIIMDTLCNYHNFDIQWGNHDILWMGAASGNDSCIANVIRMSMRYGNLGTLEDGYGINLLPLATFAMDTYADDPCTIFMPKMNFADAHYNEKTLRLITQMHKAITIIQFKLEAEIIDRRPEFGMANRKLLEKIDFERGVFVYEGKEYALRDTNFPTVDPADPYRLTEEERELVEKIHYSFMNSEKLKKHMRCLFTYGGMYLVSNSNLLYHASVPLNEDGSFKRVKIRGKEYWGRKLLDKADQLIRTAYFDEEGEEDKEFAMDYIWYMWCGPEAPLFDKDKMATFERYFVEDKEFLKSFQEHSAAKTVHHGFIGGLMEHTLSVTKLCDYMASAYPLLKRDLLITAALLHDVGKTKELSSFPLNDYTDEGQLLGHIIIGAQMIHDLAKEIPDFPEMLENQLVHCILAHHGELEYGSPKKPALLEALALNFADNTDAKMETMLEVLKSGGENPGWLGYNRFLETNVRKTTPTE